MKKKLIQLLGVMLIITAVGAIIIKLTDTKENTEVVIAEDKIQVVTTFYPVYMIGLNLADQVEGMEVKSLTDLNTGCLHDYQLTTEDMRRISSADVMIINGGGMESFMEDVVVNYPNLKIIDASQGITMLSNETEGELGIDTEADKEADNEANKLSSEDGTEVNGVEVDSDHEHGEYNPHVWLDPKLYIKQIENVRSGLIDYLTDSKTDVTVISEAIDKNAQKYIEEVTLLDNEIDKSMNDIEAIIDQGINDRQAIIFHDSFAYLANRAGMTVAFTVPLDSDTALSAGDIKDIIDTVRAEDIKYLFTEQQYSDSIAKQIEAETEAKVYIIDSVVTGDGAKNSYLTAMQNNLQVLIEAIK